MTAGPPLHWMVPFLHSLNRPYWLRKRAVKASRRFPYNESMNIATQAKNLGFIASGVSPCEKPLFFDAFCKWIDAEKFGQMKWIQRHRSLREDPGKLLRECRTVISLAYPYSSTKPCTA